MLVAAEAKDNIWKEPGQHLVAQELQITTPAWSAGPGAALTAQNSLSWESRGCSSVLPAALGLGCCCQFGPWGKSASEGTINCSFLSGVLPPACPPQLDVIPFQAPLLGLGSRWEAGSASPHLWHFPKSQDLELLALSSHREKLSDGSELEPGPISPVFTLQEIPAELVAPIFLLLHPDTSSH